MIAMPSGLECPTGSTSCLKHITSLGYFPGPVRAVLVYGDECRWEYMAPSGSAGSPSCPRFIAGIPLSSSLVVALRFKWRMLAGLHDSSSLGRGFDPRQCLKVAVAQLGRARNVSQFLVATLYFSGVQVNSLALLFFSDQSCPLLSCLH